MSPGDLIFGKPVMLQSYTGKTLVNSKDTEVAVVKVCEGETACVQLIRNDDGTVSIQSMRNKLYLSVDDYEDDGEDYNEEDEDDDGDDDNGPVCCFDASKIKNREKFRLEFADERAFVL